MAFCLREAVLAVKPEKGALLRLSLPSPTEPYVLLRYHSGAMIPVPMRPVIVTVDLVERRLVAYFQTTYADQPPLRKVELRAVLPGQTPAEGETEARFRERSEAVLGDLRRCPAPTGPIEACATPEREPDRRIFSHESGQAGADYDGFILQGLTPILRNPSMPGTQTNDLIDQYLFRQEVARGEKVGWIFRWFMYGLVFVLANLVWHVQDSRAGSTVLRWRARRCSTTA